MECERPSERRSRRREHRLRHRGRPGSGHEQDEGHGPENRRKDAAFGHPRLGRAGQKLPADPRQAVDDDVAQDDPYHREDEEAGEPRQAREAQGDDLDPAAHGSAFQLSLQASRLLIRQP